MVSPERAGVSVSLAQYEQLRSARKVISELEKAVQSALQWEQSWVNRVFHRWRLSGKLKLRLKELTKACEVSMSPREKAEVKVIEQSGLFDKNWYRAQYGQLIGDQEIPILHYLRHGVALGLNPSPHFSTQGYLDLYTDIAAAQMNPLLHYICAGMKERRCPNAMSIKELQDLILAPFASRATCLHPGKKTVLLVTHELSRTGAPMIVLNIARMMRRNFNIIVLSLGPGDLEEDFTKVCDVLIRLDQAREYIHFERLSNCVFQRLTAECAIQFALVNSIGSSAVIKPLWENDVPVIHLIHEFASYTRPRGIFLKSAIYSSLQVYPAAMVRENVFLDEPEIRDARSIILPQGRNSAPGKSTAPELAEEERQLIRAAFRPAGFSEETVVIVGMGTVDSRKGVDLFIMCAMQVVAQHPRTPFRFVWIGHGYNPENDLFSMFLADQIQRSGLKDHFVIMNAVAEIEEAHRLADMLFLSSRLDPLPLVSLDAMAHGLPVVCFEKATGIAEYLLQDPDAAFGIVPYLDTLQAAQRICRLIDDSARRKKVGEGCRRMAETVFDFERYVRRLEELGREEAEAKAREKADRALIQKSNLINPEFYLRPENASLSGDADAALKHYMNPLMYGIWRRKPFPGFHPGIYAECNHVHDRDPLARYIEAGEPDGPWCFPIVEKCSPPPEGKTPRVGLQIHLYFPDLAGQIFERIQSIRTPMDLLISVPSKEVEKMARSLGREYTQGRVEIRIVPNRGRDIGPFLTEFGREILANYDIVGHIHTKKTIDSQDRLSIERWARSLYENLLGCKEPMADTIIDYLLSNEKTGLIFPDDPFVVGWGENRGHALALAERLKIAHLLPQTALNFPVGTMFWARTAAIRPLLELGLNWDDYPPEPVPYDGSVLHAIERILPYVVESTGFTSAVTYVSGCTR